MTFLPITENSILLPKPAYPAQATQRINEWQNSARQFAPELEDFIISFCKEEHHLPLLNALFGNSDYLSNSLIRETAFFKDLTINGIEATVEQLMESLDCHVETFANKAVLMQFLREKKRQMSLLIAIADISQYWSLTTVTHALSQFADSAIQLAVRYLLYQAICSKELESSTPHTPEIDSGLLVLALGKLGGYELNYSSDVDLIIFYDHQLENYHGKLSIGQFFIRLAKEMVDILQTRTKDGYVFRTDLRLRPDPGANPIAITIQTAEIYYENLGQNWERAAMIKARPVIGAQKTIERFQNFIHPFIWRRALDFASIEDIHSIKRQIDSRHGKLPENLYGYNVKLGRGGIREIEFFVQTQQLIWGGRRKGLQLSSTCDAMQALVHEQEINQQTCNDLVAAYTLLRTIEHRLQMANDQQTHNLPNNLESMQAIAVFMGYKQVGDFIDELVNTITMVQGYYAQLFEASPSLASIDPNIGGSLVFTGIEDDPETLETLEKMGFEQAIGISATIRGWHHGRYRSTSTRRAREILTELMPFLLTALSKTTNPDVAFVKFDEFLHKLPSGVQIFSLLNSNPKLLDLISNILGGYPYIANHLSRSPALLDYVLAPEFYNLLPDSDSLKQSLEETLAPANDLQDTLDLIRYWTNDRRFRVGIQWIERAITAHTVSLNLTHIAEAVIERIKIEIQKEFEEVHGTIPGSEFAIIAFGKLGGKELTFNSDLDLVFIYEVEHKDGVSDGSHPLIATQYFTRLSRRFVNAVTALTKEGTLYDIDLRLRPSGKDGPVATSLHAFREYYGTSAWIWEYMALTRARVITASPGMFEKIQNIFTEKLCQEWDQKELLQGVMDMHKKTRRHKKNNYLNLKHIEGGLVDLEYIIQYLQLRHAYQHPDILDTSSMEALNRLYQADIITREDKNILLDALTLYTDTQSTFRLASIPTSNENLLTAGMKRTLAYHTHTKDFQELKKILVSSQKKVQNLFNKLILEHD